MVQNLGNYAKAAFDSLYGRIESKWTLENGNFNLAVTIPANAEGIVRLPVSSIVGITEQGQALDQVDGICEIRQEGETIILIVGSGHYHFSAQMRSI